MAELSLVDVFPGATQTSSSVTIPKAALPTLTALADNKVEGILAAIVIRAAQVLTTEARDADPTARSIVVEPGSPRVERTYDASNNALNWLVRELTVNFYEAYVEQPWDADNY